VLRPKAIPVTTISHDEYVSRRSIENRCAVTPTARVSAAEPKRDAVTTAPICTPENPRCKRNAGRTTYAMPSTNARTPRVAMMSFASELAEAGRNAMLCL